MQWILWKKIYNLFSKDFLAKEAKDQFKKLKR